MAIDKLKFVAAAAGVAITAMTLTAQPASAAAAAPATSAQVQPGPSQLAAMSFYDDFWKLEDCLKVGKDGKNAGKWWTFSCEEGWIDWDLYVAWN